MKRVCGPLTLAAFWVLAPALGADTCDSPTPANARPHELYHQLPLHFEANQGQTNPAVRYLARGSGYALFLTPQEAVLVLRAPAREDKDSRADVLRFRLKGASPSPTVEGTQRLEGKANYLIGNDPSRWRTDIPLYGRVRVDEIYPGVSLTYYGNQRQLEYDFVVAPGADPRAIRLRVEGARSIRLDGDGNLVIRTRHGELFQKAPLVYQVRDGVRQPVPGRFRLRGQREVAFDVPAYDRSLALVIDPVVVWSVYLGGNAADSAEAVAMEVRSATELNTYVTGSTFSLDFPLQNAVIGTNQGSDDAFVTKLQYTTAPVSLNLSYSTYLGGSGSDIGRGIAVDSSGNAYVTGSTTSGGAFPGPGFPRSGGPAFGGVTDAFVSKLFSTGTGFFYSRFLGGSGTDIGYDIALDAQNNAYVVGETSSTTLFPIVGTSIFQGALKPPIDGFFTKIDASGSLTSPFALFSTYLGGNGNDWAFGIEVRDLGAGLTRTAHIVGRTSSPDFPTKPPLLQPGLNGPSDAFVTTFEGSGSALTQGFGTYLGGVAAETAFAVDVVGGASAGPYDGIYVAGETSSDNFPTRDALQPVRRGSFDGFVSRIRLGGSPLVYSTYLGGGLFDSASGVAVDGSGFAYVTGSTSSPDFPLFRPLQTSLKGSSDAFVSKVVPTGCSLMYSTYWGGAGMDDGLDIAVNSSGTAAIVGKTSSADFPITLVPPLAGATFGVYRGGATDGFVTHITDNVSGDVQLTKVDSPDPVLLGQPLTYTLNLRNISPDAPAYGITLTDTLPASVTFVSVTPAANCSFGSGIVTCNFSCLAPSPGPGDLVDVVITVTPNSTGIISNFASVMTQDAGEPTANNSVGPVSTTVNPAADLAVTKTSIPATVDVNGTYLYRINVTNAGPSAATGVQIVDTLPVGVTYLAATGIGVTCNPPPASVVTCTVSSPIPSLGSVGPIDITVLANAAGVLTNQVTVDGLEDDPDLTDNMATADTTVQVPGTAVRHFTVRSRGGVALTDVANENLLEWVNAAGPAATVRISRTVGAPCVYETTFGLANEIHARPFVPNSYEFFTDDEGGPAPPGLMNGTTYCYTIFVTGGGAPLTGSPRFNSGRPFDAVTDRVRWANNLGTWSMAPVGNGLGVVHVVANDNVLYSLVKGTSGGSWPGPNSPPSFPPFPLQWTPFGFMFKPAQGRPGTYPVPLGPANSVVFLSSQDGQVYAIDAERGGAAPGPWTSPALGSTVIPSVSAMFTVFGGGTDAIVVGSREAPLIASAFYGLRLSDGTFGPPGWKQDGGPPIYPNGKIGPVLGQAAVDYNTSPPRVYFANRAFGAAPDNNTLWCLNLLTGAVIWARPYGDIDAGVTLRGNVLYIATNAGTVQAVDKNSGNANWIVSGPFAITPSAEGPAKGFIYAPVAPSTELFFASMNRIWKLTDAGNAFSNDWPIVAMNSPATPIVVPGEPFVWVGSGDGRLHRRNATNGSPFDSFPLGDLSAAVGSPTFDLRRNFVYVGTEAGIVYALEKP